MMSSEERIDALEEVRDVIASHNLPPIKQRKFNGIFNAIEMQIEDDDFNLEAVEHLGNAVIAVAKEHQLTIQPIEEALAVVYDSLKK
jgi:hypothetical protein